MMIKRLYYRKGLKNDSHFHAKRCKACLQRNRSVVYYTKLHFSLPEMPMQFISTDPIGEFHPKSSAGNAYTLAVMCMLTGYTFYVPIKTKTASEVVQAYIDNVYSKFGGSSSIFSDKGTEFKHQLFDNVAEQLGVQYKVYFLLYHPKVMGGLKVFIIS